MAFLKRVVLFMSVNILIVVTLSIVLSLLGVQPYLTAAGINYEALAIFCLVWGMGGAFISLALSRVMAKMMMGVQIIDPDNASGDLRALVQRVHNLARAAGLPAMPQVGIYHSPEVNAFATGPTKSRALVAVSSGLLQRMNASEVDGVLGHEIAHIANGDMVTMTLVQGVVNAFVMFLARVIAFAVTQFLNRNSDEENPSYFMQYMITMFLEIVLSFLGMIVVAWFSRLREYRADQGGAQFAGRSNMIAALEALRSAHQLVDNSQPALATMKISGKRGGLLALFSTHPDLEDRIARLRQGV
jgi:heat shock protein HtpX